MKKKIVAFGEVVWDILPGERILGGTPLNLVFRCNSFGDDCVLLSRLGNDELGRKALERLKELGISDENIQVDNEFPTGTVKVTFHENNEAIYEVIQDVAFDHIEFSAEALKLARKADCLFYGLLPQRFGISKNTLRELIKESPKSIHFFDLKLFEHFFDKRVVEQLLYVSRIVRIKEKEISFLKSQLGLTNGNLEEFGFNLANKYDVDLVLITRGSNGVLACHKSLGIFADSGYKIEVEDNVGSGMAFCGAFIHSFMQGNSIPESLKFGNAAGALNTTRRGATSGFNKKDVLEFIRKAGRI